MAFPSHTSEKAPLLHHARRPCQGLYTPPSRIRSKEAVVSPSAADNTHSSVFALSFRTKIVLAMVAIPAYLLASSAVSSLGPLTPRDSVIRSPAPEPEPVPQTSSSLTTGLSSDPFASVLGPLVSSNFPDPAIIYVDGVSYAFATNNREQGPAMIHVQVATSTDNQTWTVLDQDALPQVGAWETGARVWAPDVIQVVSITAKARCMNTRLT